MEKKRILFYNGQLLIGGIERVLTSYLQGLANEDDLEITVLIKENNPEKKQNIKCSMSIRIYLNTLKQAYDAILNTGIEAKYNEIDKGDYMEVVVKIPKK